MKHILKKRSGPVQLLHVTRITSFEPIIRDGIRASKRGIFSVNGSNGAGIYAIHNDLDVLRRLIARCFPQDDPEDLIVILFSYSGEYYECLRVFLSEEERAKLDEAGISDVVTRARHIVIPGEDAHIGADLIIGLAQVHALAKEISYLHL